MSTYVHMFWLLSSAVVAFSNKEALLDIEGCDGKVDEFHTKEDTGLWFVWKGLDDGVRTPPR